MKKLNRATKYMLILSAVMVVFNAILGYVLTKEASLAMRTLINERMLDISNTAAAMLDGDELARLTADDYNSPEYQHVMDTLTYFQENIELEYIYCIMQVSEREFVFGVDPTIEDPGEFGSPIVYTDALYNASKGKAGVDDVPYKDEWGEFYSSYTPVFDSEGNVAGIVAADFSAEWYRRQIRRLCMATGLIIVLALAFSIAVMIAIATQYGKNFKKLIKKTNELSNGIEELIHEISPEMEASPSYYTADSDMKMNDEISLLGERILVMQDRLSTEIEVIRARAYLDILTGLHNRSAYEDYVERLEKKMEDASRLQFTVVVFDINQLKTINDDFGHEKGDELIIGIAGDIRESFPGDRLYRIGGDEFVAVIDDPDPSPKIAKLREIIARKNHESPVFHDNTVEIGLSIGAATYDWTTGESYSDVFNRADQAMYADKQKFYQTHDDRRKKR